MNVQRRKFWMAGAGSSRLAKNDENTDANSTANAPEGHAVTIQKAQTPSTATIKANADSRARPESLCRGLRARARTSVLISGVGMSGLRTYAASRRASRQASTRSDMRTAAPITRRERQVARGSEKSM